jgi:hypothetical protein
MPYKLAITIAGAVSLGTYEAGVLYEVVDAIRQHNEKLPPTSENRIVIDVLTGASAGGVSATVLAQKLFYESQKLDGPYENALYQAWVKDLDIQGLMHLQKGDDPWHAIFSSTYVDFISKRYLTQRYEGNVNPSNKHAAAGSEIRLGLALANLTGVNYERPMLPEGTFTYTRFQDEMSRTIDSTTDNAAFWEPLRQAAVSCGSFPFAFSVRELTRRKAEYPPDAAILGDPVTFTFTDGGTFQNEPLGLAKNLVDQIPNSHEEADRRFYLFISPHDKASTENTAILESDANYLELTRALINAVYNQAGFQDWSRALDVNKQIKLFNERAEQLRHGILSGDIPWKPLQDAADQLLPRLIPEERVRDDARRRLRTQFRLELAEPENWSASQPEKAKAWIDSILVFETAAELGARDEMVIYGITAKSSELAGAALQAFVGFFDKKYRFHDYEVGRQKARNFLMHSVLGTKGNLPKIDYVPSTISIDHTLDGLNLDEGLTGAILDRLRERTDDLVETAELGRFTPLKRKLAKFAAHEALKKLGKHHG